MATTNETQQQNNPQDELEDLQERALHHDIDLADPTGRELSADELRPLVENAEMNQEQMTPEEREYEKAKANEKRANAQALAEAQGGQRSISDPIVPPSISSNAPSSHEPLPRRTRSELPPALGPQPVSGELAQKLGLEKASDADIDLARKHNYPVAIPGAKAYVTDISMRCAMGGGERPAGSVILLLDAHARNKLEYLTPVEQVPERHHVSVPQRGAAPQQPAQTTQAQPPVRAGQPKNKAQQGSKGKGNK